MNLYLIIGTIVVVFALISYSVGIFIEQKTHLIIKNVLIFMTLGIILDITATTFMIAGSSNSPFSLHGILGYSSLLAMLIDVLLIWKFHLQKPGQKVSKGLHLYSKLAYIWWVLAFITGGMMAALK